MQKIVEVTKLYRRIERANKKTIVNVGGAGSSKSFSLVQFFIFERLLKLKNYRLLFLRKTRHSNKLSIHLAFMEILKLYDLYKEAHHNKSDLIYSFPTRNNYILFAGLDDKERIKSTEWHDIVMEEGNEFVKTDYTFLKATRLYRGQMTSFPKNFIPRMWLVFNPVDCWIFDLEGRKDVDFLYSSHKDNEFVNKESVRELENLKNEDDTLYKIYALGQRAKLKGTIYEPYTVVNNFPEHFDETIYGLDFGFNSPTALLEVNIADMKSCYLRELIYQTQLNNPARIELLKELIPDRRLPIYADSEDPADIDEIYNAGFNVHPCVKYPGSVKDQILFAKRFRYFSLPTNINLNKERDYYKWREDKNGNTLDEPVKFRNHLMNAKEYALHTHFKQSGLVPDICTIKNELKQIPDRMTATQEW